MERLAAQVERLQHRVDELATGMVRVATEIPGDAVPEEGEGKKAKAGHEDLVAWAGATSILPRVSTLSFLLVVALALRTLSSTGAPRTRIAPNRANPGRGGPNIVPDRRPVSSR